MAPPPGMHCPTCDNFLIPRLTKGGLAPNTYLAQCVNPRHTPFHFRYGPEFSPPAPASALPPPSQDASVSSTASSGKPRATPGEPRRCVGTTREGAQCKSTRVDLACSRHMCRKHCNATGPCKLARHAAAPNPSVPNTAVPPPPPPPLPRQQSADPWARSFDDMLADVTCPLRLLGEYQEQEAARAAEEGRRLDIAVGMPPDSPELMQRMEQGDRAFAFRLSEELNGANGDLFPPSPPPTAIAGPSRLRTLSLSPDLPLHITIPSPLPALSRATAPDAPGKRPRQRLGAASAMEKHRPAPSFKITTQLNDTWMSQNGGGSTSPSQTPPSSQPIPRPSAVFHVRQGGSRRQLADRRQAERFMLVYLTGSDPRILSVDASELTAVPWPSYQLSSDDKTCKALGTDLQPDLDVFLERQRVWMGIESSFIHSVSKDCVIVLRRRGIHGPDDDEIIQKFLPRPAPAPAHLRYNLKAERTAVRATIKSNTPLIILESDSDNDMEVSAVTAAPTGRKRRIKREDDTLPRPPQRPRLAINTDISAACIPPLSSTDSPPPSALSLYSPSLSSASEPATPLEPSEPATALDPALKWPGGMYTVEVVNGFLRMDSLELARMNRGLRFEHVFKRTYKSATYDDNVRRWKSASPELQRRSLAAGRTEDGLWSTFRTNLNAERARD